MFDAEAALALLQYGDSAYPAGGFAFSWGVEGLAADGLLASRQDLDDIAWEHLTLRWNSMDRPLLGRAFRAADVSGVTAVDRYAETATPSAAMREGSRRAGRALLGVSVRLGGPLSTLYRASVSQAPLLGHLVAVQAVVYRDAGLDLASAELVSGWTLVNGLVSAAVRLGVIGHVEAQRSLGLCRAVLADLLAEPVPAGASPSSFTPLVDIAISRSRPVRMFTT
ncbi:urease accessory protein UreF [Lichenibacterium ramalinae]|uniref:Urease accessory protein UreF n=1 Tax=Lichenibacterium ramalinae TaxID=2316527 RepID=A0A4Q2RCF7_9HYPH|nr:urease accessory UreF family protein [Lichenibacterium ramalinae]RYB05191.1 urease accessory protein UreF [Lichenibacterium ramalinae]